MTEAHLGNILDRECSLMSFIIIHDQFQNKFIVLSMYWILNNAIDILIVSNGVSHECLTQHHLSDPILINIKVIT